MAEDSRREKDLSLVEDFETVRAITADGRSVQVPKSKFGGNLEVASANVLGGIKADEKSDSYTQEVKIDPLTGKLFVPQGEGTPPDDEDITVAEIEGTGKLQFKDKKYNASSFSGLGRTYLRKNMVNGKNELTQAMFTNDDGSVKGNTRYVIQYDYDLKGADLNLPENCILDFQGGSINNGVISLSSSNFLNGNQTKCNNLRIRVRKNIEYVSIEDIELVGVKVENASSKSELTCAIEYTSEYSINIFNMERCIIHGYNRGVNLKASNVYVSNNLFYDNGALSTVDGIHDGEVDLELYAATSNVRNNIIIKNNKFLSNYVHRNLDIGELYSESNILVDGNICVPHKSLNEEDRDTMRKSYSIIVGYTGVSTENKNAIICNNIIKHSHWSGIYVRGNNTKDTLFNSKYIVNIHDNYLENIKKKGDSTFLGAIGVEVREGSIIANNIITDCTWGINLGFVLNDSHSIVTGNNVTYVDVGILIDSFGYNLDIQNNILKYVNIGISLNESTDADSEQWDKFAKISNNVIQLDSANGTEGVRVFNYYSQNLNIEYNQVYGCINAKGITLREPSGRSESLRFMVRGNVLSGLKYGVVIEPTSHLRNKGRYVDYNVFNKCTTAIYVGVNASNQLFVVEGNVFNECASKFNDQSWARCVYEGVHIYDEKFIIYDERGRGDFNNSVYGYISNAQVCFFTKFFKKGDVVIPVDGGGFTKAVCMNDYTEPSDSGSLWRLDNARLGSAASAICALNGQMVYDSTLKKVKYHNGTDWVVL